MLDVLLLMVPDHSEDQEQEAEHQYITNISPQTLDEDAKTLAEKLDYFSSYITRYQRFLRALQVKVKQLPSTRQTNTKCNDNLLRVSHTHTHTPK